MALATLLLSEIEQEFANTRKMLEQIPDDKLDWKPHEKSMSLGQLSVHIANIAGLAGLMLASDELDFATVSQPEIHSPEDILKLHDEGAAHTKKALKAAKDEDFNKEWTMHHGEHVIMKMPVKDFMRKMALSHIYHHRGQLSVYLRLLNIPIPGMYGPSADDS